MDLPGQSPALQFLNVDGPRRMAWWDWPSAQGSACRQVVICVHGLSRQGRDFDVLAQALAPRSHVVAVDVAGRGHSDSLPDPAGYQLGTYVADLVLLVRHLRGRFPQAEIDWVGTSMGGLIGMAVAAQPAWAPRRLVLNDVGPTIEWAALQRIASYLGQDPVFESERAAGDYLAAISEGFGPHTPAQWAALTRPMLRWRHGSWRLHYDPAIAVPLKALVNATDEAASRAAVLAGETGLWALYDAIHAKTLVLRGAQSDLLTPGTAQRMTERGPRASCISFDGVGHAPTLIAPDQVDAVRRFLWAD